MKKTFKLNNLPNFFFNSNTLNLIQNNFFKFEIFHGDYVINTHFSQHSYILGCKNNFFFYDINKSLMLLNNALSFLKSVNVQNDIKYVFVGTPKGDEKKITYYAKKFKFNNVFFPNNKWYPGYISKSTLNKNSVLIVYDINLNNLACKEAIKSNIPVVGFSTPSCDIRGVDYPILLNFKKFPSWYIKFLLAIF